jgi:uncharacterized Zn finger protein (UPF0148 family)
MVKCDNPDCEIGLFNKDGWWYCPWCHPIVDKKVTLREGEYVGDMDIEAMINHTRGEING